jgi:hypothetical protein
MKKHLLAAKALLALAGPAMAFGSNGTIMPNDPSIDTENLANVDAVMLECYPPIDRSKRDPVQRTNIDLTFKPGVSDQRVATLDVRHTLFSNRVIDRNTQYAGNVWKRSGYNGDRHALAGPNGRSPLKRRLHNGWHDPVHQSGKYAVPRAFDHLSAILTDDLVCRLVMIIKNTPLTATTFIERI